MILQATLRATLPPINDYRGMAVEDLNFQQQVLTFHVLDGKIDKAEARRRDALLAALLRVRLAERELDLALADLGIVAMQNGMVATSADAGPEAGT